MAAMEGLLEPAGGGPAAAEVNANPVQGEMPGEVLTELRADIHSMQPGSEPVVSQVECADERPTEELPPSTLAGDAQAEQEAKATQPGQDAAPLQIEAPESAESAQAPVAEAMWAGLEATPLHLECPDSGSSAQAAGPLSEDKPSHEDVPLTQEAVAGTDGGVPLQPKSDEALVSQPLAEVLLSQPVVEALVSEPVREASLPRPEIVVDESSYVATQCYTEDIVDGRELDGVPDDGAPFEQGLADAPDTQIYEDIPVVGNLKCDMLPPAPPLRAVPAAAHADDSVMSTQCYLGPSTQEDFNATQQYSELASPAAASDVHRSDTRQYSELGRAENNSESARRDFSLAEEVNATQQYSEHVPAAARSDIQCSAAQQHTDLGPAGAPSDHHRRGFTLAEAEESATQCYLDFGAEFLHSGVGNSEASSSSGGVILTSCIDGLSSDVAASSASAGAPDAASSASTSAPEVVSSVCSAVAASAAPEHASATALSASAPVAAVEEEPPLTQCYQEPPLTQCYQGFQFSGPVHDVPDDESSDEGDHDGGNQSGQVPSASSTALGAAPKWRPQPKVQPLCMDMPPPPVPKQKQVKRALPAPATPSRVQQTCHVATPQSAEKRRRRSLGQEEPPWTPGRRLCGKQPVPESARRSVKRAEMVLGSKQDVLPTQPLRDNRDDSEDGDDDAVMWLGEADRSKFMDMIKGASRDRKSVV